MKYDAIKYILAACIFAGMAVSLPSCGGAKLSTANEQMARGEYFDAAKTYRKIYNKHTKKEERPLRGEVAFKMAECHRQLNQFQRAAAAYQNAIRYEWPDTMAYLYLAEMQHGAGQYAQAVKSYEAFLDMRPDSKAAQTGLAGARKSPCQEWRHTICSAQGRYVQFSAQRLFSDVHPRSIRQALFLNHTRESQRTAQRNNGYEKGRYLVCLKK